MPTCFAVKISAELGGRFVEVDGSARTFYYGLDLFLDLDRLFGFDLFQLYLLCGFV